MKRRALIAAIGAVAIAGCTSTETDGTEYGPGYTGDSPGATGADAEATDQELVDRFATFLIESGVEPVFVERVGAVFDLVYDATGTADTDVGIEIEIVADAYAEAVLDGLTTDRLQATSRHPSDEVALDFFAIETMWVEAYLDEEISWEEYLARVESTFVPSSDGRGSEPTDQEPADTQPADDQPPAENVTDDTNESTDTGGTDGNATNSSVEAESVDEEGGDGDGSDEDSDDDEDGDDGGDDDGDEDDDDDDDDDDD